MINLKKISLISLIIIFLSNSLSGCIEPKDDPILPNRGFFIGILPTTAKGQEFNEAYTQAAQYSEFVPIWSIGTGADGFWDYAQKLKGSWGNIFLKDYIRGNGMFPIIHFSFIDKNNDQLILRTPDYLPDATLSNSDWRALYKKSVLDIVRATLPLYLSLGNEVNRWFEAYGVESGNPNGFQNFVSLYEEIYDEVKKISPKTIVFCVFSREIVSEYREADLSVLEMFDENKLDILVFTSYPHSVSNIKKPSDIPNDYYSKIFNYITNKPFGFSEIGWPCLEQFGGEQAQAEFLINISSTLTINKGIELHLLGYCWLHDLDDNDTIGLINRNGTEKLGYQAWKDISILN